MVHKDWGVFATASHRLSHLGFFSPEPAAPALPLPRDAPDDGLGGRRTCDAGFGTAAFVTGAFGLCAAGVVVRLIADDAPPPNALAPLARRSVRDAEEKGAAGGADGASGGGGGGAREEGDAGGVAGGRSIAEMWGSDGERDGGGERGAGERSPVGRVVATSLSNGGTEGEPLCPSSDEHRAEGSKGVSAG